MPIPDRKSLEDLIATFRGRILAPRQANPVAAPKQQGLPDAQVRQLATKYRDEWLAKSMYGDGAVLARSTIVSVERQPQGWHVTFMTPTGHNPATPEGIHDYYLHVYVTPSGKLDRIVKGPDIVS